MVEIKLQSQVPGAVPQRGSIFTEAAWGFWQVRVQYDLKKTVTGNIEKRDLEKMSEYSYVIYL